MKARFIRNGLWNLALVMVLTIVAVNCAERKEAKIGAMLPLSGDAASYGDEGRKGIDLAVEEINAGGGIKGRQLKVIYEDSRAASKEGAAAMQKLATVDKVPAVIGGITSAETLAAAPIAERNKVVLLSPTASAPKISDAGEFIFRIWPSDTAEGTTLANFAYNSLGLLKVAILHLKNEYGVAIKDVFTKRFTFLGGTVVATESYGEQDTDFRSQLDKIKATKPQAIYLISYYKDAALVFRQAREKGIKVQFLGTTAIEEPKMVELAGDAAEGVIYPLAGGFDKKSTSEIVRKFYESYRRKYNEEPGWVAAQCYDTVKLIAYCMEKGGLKGPAIQSVMAQIRDYRGATGDISFDEKGDVIKQVVIKTIRNGQFVPYEKQ